MPMSNAEKQRRKRAKLATQGLKQCNVTVPESTHADLNLQAQLLRAYPHLMVGPLRDSVSGKFVALR